jgi:predicted transcriptional regulator
VLRLPDLNLGDLEMATLECLWRLGEADVKRVHAEIGVERGVTLNTVQSTLDRLHRKDLLGRRKFSHAFIYSPAIERSALVGRAISAVLGMTGGGAGEMLTAFVDVAARTDLAVLNELEALLAARISAARAAL